jgi:hypothetical protein
MKNKQENQAKVVIVLDAQQMIADIQAKYGKKPILSSKGKKLKAELERQKNS